MGESIKELVFEEKTEKQVVEVNSEDLDLCGALMRVDPEEE